MSIIKIAAVSAVLTLGLAGCASTSETDLANFDNTTSDTEVVEENNGTTNIPSTNNQEVVSQLRSLADKSCTEAKLSGAVEIDEFNGIKIVLVPESQRDFGVLGWYEIDEEWEPLYEVAGHSACSLSEDFASLEAAYGSPDSTFKIELVDDAKNQYLFTSIETGETREVQYVPNASGLIGQVNVLADGEVVLERPISYGYSEADAETYSAYIAGLEALSADDTVFSE